MKGRCEHCGRNYHPNRCKKGLVCVWVNVPEYQIRIDKVNENHEKEVINNGKLE